VEQQKPDVKEQKPGEQKWSLGDGFIGMLNAFVDPAAAAKRIPAPLSWLWPMILLSILAVVFGYLMLPYQFALQDAQIAQRTTDPEQIERARNLAHTATQLLVPAAPVFVAGFLALFAWLIGLFGSIVGMRTKFRDVFSLLAACSLIPALQAIANYIVIRAKGDEIVSAEQLTPPFGLDIYLPDIHGPLFALVNFFSIFEIWYLIVLTFGLAYLAKTSRGKAFFAITPAWLLPLVARVVQGMLQGGQGN